MNEMSMINVVNDSNNKKEMVIMTCEFCGKDCNGKIYRMMGYIEVGTFAYCCDDCKLMYNNDNDVLCTLIMDDGVVIKHEWTDEDVCGVCDGLMCDVCIMNKCNRRGVVVRN